MRSFSLIGFALAASFLLIGCQEGTLFGDNRANIAGAASVVDPTALEAINVAELITAIDNQAGRLPSIPPATLEDAINNYERRNPNPAAWANLRNTLQDRLLIASQSRCGFYEEYLRRFQSNSETFFGSLSTILGGAGAIVTGANGARALAGLAGISSGVGAEMQKDLFSGVTSTVIVPGIEKRRASILKSILSNRCQTPDRYTIGLALADALSFHSACAMDVGIDEGANAVKQAANPGNAGLVAFISMGGQINQAQSVRVSIDKNRQGGSPGGTTTISSSIAAPDSTVQSMLDSLNGGMSVRACPSNTGQLQAPPPIVKKGAAAKAKAAPVAATAPPAPIPPLTPDPPLPSATPTKPG